MMTTASMAGPQFGLRRGQSAPKLITREEAKEQGLTDKQLTDRNAKIKKSQRRRFRFFNINEQKTARFGSLSFNA